MIHYHDRDHLVTKVRFKDLQGSDRGDFRCRRAVDSSIVCQRVQPLTPPNAHECCVQTFRTTGQPKWLFETEEVSQDWSLMCVSEGYSISKQPQGLMIYFWLTVCAYCLFVPLSTPEWRGLVLRVWAGGCPAASQTLRNAYLGNCWTDFLYSKFYGII